MRIQNSGNGEARVCSQLTLVLFDEIEKANEALWQLLLGILDKGILPALASHCIWDFLRAVLLSL